MDEGLDEEGDENNLVRRVALELLERAPDDLSDLEIIGRAPDDFWYVDLCLERLHRLPSEVDLLLTCREYTQIHAYSIVKQAQQRAGGAFRDATGPKGF